MAKVTSQNPFDLLGEADFDGEVKAPKVQPKKVAVPPKSAPTAAPKAKAQENRAPKDANRVPRPSANAEGDFQSAREPRQGAKTRAQFKNRGNPRGRGRDYDRRSGTGRVDTEKAISQGWGHETENLEETAPVESSGETKEIESPVVEVEANPEDNVKTLEEYYAELKAEKVRFEESVKQLRKANEGADDSQWVGATALKKNDQEFFAGKGAQAKGRKPREKTTKNLVEIEQKFNETNDRRNDRNDRRTARGGARGARGSQRGPKPESSRPVNLTDQSAFPSLGA